MYTCTSISSSSIVTFSSKCETDQCGHVEDCCGCKISSCNLGTVERETKVFHVCVVLDWGLLKLMS